MSGGQYCLVFPRSVRPVAPVHRAVVCMVDPRLVFHGQEQLRGPEQRAGEMNRVVARGLRPAGRGISKHESSLASVGAGRVASREGACRHVSLLYIARRRASMITYPLRFHTLDVPENCMLYEIPTTDNTVFCAAGGELRVWAHGRRLNWLRAFASCESYHSCGKTTRSWSRFSW